MHVTNGLVLIIVEEAFMTEFASIIERSGGQDPGIELPQSARGGYRKWLRYAEPNATNIFRCQFQNLHILQAKAAIKAQRPSPPPGIIRTKYKPPCASPTDRGQPRGNGPDVQCPKPDVPLTAKADSPKMAFELLE
jgi:hypothetical protein